MNDRRGRRQRQGRDRPGYGPLLDGTRDAVDAGYQGLEYMLEGLRASIEQRPRTASGRGADGLRVKSQRRRAQPAIVESESGQTGPTDLVTQLMSIFAEVLNRAGDAAQAFAEAVVEQSWLTATEVGTPAWLEGSAEPGEEAIVVLRVWNPGSSELRNVRLVACDLIGEEDRRIGADLVTTTPSKIERIAPNDDAKVSVAVSVPADAKPGEYRTLIQADPGEAWAILELTVKPITAAARRSARKAAPAPARKATRAKAAKTKRARARKATRVPTRTGPRPSPRKATRAPARKATRVPAKKTTRATAKKATRSPARKTARTTSTKTARRRTGAATRARARRSR